MDPLVVFFITTARSATQWLALSLDEAYGDLLEAQHEPVGFDYAPCRTLRNPAALKALADAPAIRAHFDHIHAVLDGGRSYVEVGFPGFALAPLLRREFGDALRLVQLIRDPARVAASLVTHQWYVEGKRADVQGTVALTPADPGVAMTDYSDRWATMSAFEKGLFYWGEVHGYGLEVEAQAPPGRFARFRAEDLLDADPAERRRLCAFLGLPERDAWLDAPAQHVDRFRHTTTETIAPGAIARHPAIVALAEQFGYATDESDAASLAERYRRPLAPRLRRRATRAVKRLIAAFVG